MKRDIELLRAAVPPLADDLARSLGPGWSCSFGPGCAVVVTDGQGLELLQPVEADFDPEDALPPGALESQWRDQALADDAMDTLAEAVQTALRGVVGRWPLCPTHEGQHLAVCSSTWTCPKGHDPAEVGQLPSSRAGHEPLRS